ncbi:hypothetical protein Zmor_002543 [Zophobas morio]|uniref:Uncharacterized protein n=1 Tax=Zophobas morio TaxID=2755281 RepID=A0AA38J5F4_9CUCU|nr:hypothetical protein Zmor_002543 [Zophobas morio]
MGEDVELCLEVQVDPASKKILSNPERCRSALLDVTVVKPKEFEAFGTHRTNTLRADEVRKLISSMEKQRRKKQKVMDKLKDDDTIIKIRKHDEFSNHRQPFRKQFPKYRDRISPTAPVDDLERKDFIGIAESVEPLFCEIRRSLKNVETRITDMQDINLVISQTTFDATASEEYMYSRRKKPSRLSPQTSQIPHRVNPAVYRMEAPHDLRSLILSKNRDNVLGKGDKVEGRCLCENCGIVGLLMECQKHPLLNELSESPSPSQHSSFFTRKKRTKVDVANVENWKPKADESAYIKHLSNRVKLLEERLAAQEERVVPKDYFKKIITKMVTNFSPKIFKSRSDISMPCRDKKKPQKPPSPKPIEKTRHLSKSIQCCNTNVTYRRRLTKNDKSTLTDDHIAYGGYVWKWGEEVLKPGADLKNRIVTLLTDILSKLALSDKSSAETTKLKGSVKSEKYDTEHLKKFMKRMNTKVFNAQIDPKAKFLTDDYPKREKVSFGPVLPEFAQKSREKVKSHQRREEKKNIDVSYVNPKLSSWRKESGHHNVEPEEALGKQEFLKIVSKAKQNQKDVLWKNIWNQAKANGQTKSDKITIKIPCQGGKEGQKFFETEITIGEVEELLNGVQGCEVCKNW